MTAESSGKALNGGEMCDDIAGMARRGVGGQVRLSVERRGGGQQGGDASFCIPGTLDSPSDRRLTK